MKSILLEKTYVLFGNFNKYILINAFAQLQSHFTGYDVRQEQTPIPQMGGPAFIFTKPNETWIVHSNRIDLILSGNLENSKNEIDFFVDKVMKFDVAGTRASIVSTYAILDREPIISRLLCKDGMADSPSGVSEVLLRFNKPQTRDNETFNCINSLEDGIIQQFDPETNTRKFVPALIAKTDINTKADNSEPRFKYDNLSDVYKSIQIIGAECLEKIDTLCRND